MRNRDLTWKNFTDSIRKYFVQNTIDQNNSLLQGISVMCCGSLVQPGNSVSRTDTGIIAALMQRQLRHGLVVRADRSHAEVRPVLSFPCSSEVTCVAVGVFSCAAWAAVTPGNGIQVLVNHEFVQQI